MPPKPRYSRDEMLDCAFQILREEGASSVTARDLGARLETSSRPVFTAFSGMEEVRSALNERAEALYQTHIEKALYYTMPYKRIGMEIHAFAKKEKHVFSYIFLENRQETSKNGEKFLIPRHLSETCVNALLEDFSVGKQDAELIFDHVIMTAFSLAYMETAGYEKMKEDAVCDLIGRQITSLVMLAKKGQIRHPTMTPVYKGKPHKGVDV